MIIIIIMVLIIILIVTIIIIIMIFIMIIQSPTVLEAPGSRAGVPKGFEKTQGPPTPLNQETVDDTI